MAALRAARPLLLLLAANAESRPARSAELQLELAPERLPLAWLCLGNEEPLVSGDAVARRDLRKSASLLSLSIVDNGIAAKANNTGAQQAVAVVAGKAEANSKAKQQLTPRSWFALTFSFAFVVKALCMLSNVVFQISPIPQVRQFNKFQDTGEADAAPFISILYGGCQWCFYGFFAFLVTHKSGFLVLVYSNVAGAFLGVYYVWGFQCNCNNSKSLRKLFAYYKFVSTLALLQMVAMVTLERQRALFFSGLVSSICSVVGAFSLLATLPTVLETRCSASINVPLLSVGIVSGCLWLCCGFILWDYWIMVPNMICLVIQLVAVLVVLYFPREPPPTEGLATPPLGLDAESRAAPPASAAAALAAAGAAGRGGRRQDYGTLRVLGETGGTF